MGGWRQRCAAGLIIQYYRYSFKGPAYVHRVAGITVAVAVGWHGYVEAQAHGPRGRGPASATHQLTPGWVKGHVVIAYSKDVHPTVLAATFDPMPFNFN